MLTLLTILATLTIGFARGPWWCWLIAGSALAFLSITDPRQTRPSLSDAQLGEAMAMLRADLICLSTACIVAAGAFAAGRIISWALAI
jgi:hypothetical protein